MKIKQTVFLFSACFFIYSAGSMQGRPGGDIAPVFDLSAGGHAAFMAGAYTAVSGNSSAVFYNPAGLYTQDGTEFALHYEGVAGFFSQAGYAGFSRRLSRYVTLGLGLKFLTSGDQFNSDQLSSGQFDSFGENQFLLGAALGFDLPFPVKPGLTIKLGYRSLSWDDETSTRRLVGTFFNVDAGLMLPVSKNLQFGLRLENLIPNRTFGVDGGDETVPTRFMSGALLSLFEKRLKISLDGGFLTGIKEFEYHFGISFQPFNLLDLSIGLDDSRLVFGTALYVSDFKFYYSIVLLDQLIPSMRISVNYEVGKSKDQYKQIEKELKLVNRGMSEFSSGKYQDAKETFKQILDLNPLNETALRMKRIADTRLSVKDWKSTEQKKKIQQHFQQAMVLFKTGEFADAKKEFVKVLDIDPLHWASRDKLKEINNKLRDQIEQKFKSAVKNFIRNDLTEAKKDLRELLTLSPGHKQGRELYHRITLLEKNILEQRRKEQIRLQNARIYYQRGLALMKRKIYIQAAKSFRMASQFSDESIIKTQYNLAKKKIKDLKIDGFSHRKSKQFLKLGLEQATNMQLTKAIKSLEKSLNYDPHNKKAEKKLLRLLDQRETLVKKPFKEGVALYKQGKYLAALNKWRESLKIDEEYKPAKNYITSTQKEMVKRAEYNVKLADSYLRQGGDKNVFDALKYYQRAKSLDENNIQAKRGLREAKKQVEDKAKKYFDQGFAALKSNELSRLNDAIDNFEKYLLIKSDDEQAKQFLIQARKKRREQKDFFIVQRLKKEGLDFFNNRDYKQAQTKFEQILKYDKNNRMAKRYSAIIKKRLKLIAGRNAVMKIFNEGIRHFKVREYKKAISTWKKIIDLKTATDDDKKMVAGYIDTAKEVQKYNQNKFYLRGKSFAVQDKLLEARDALSEAVKINQYHTKARDLLSDVKDRIRSRAFSLFGSAKKLYKNGNYSQSVKKLEEAVKYRDDDDRINNLLEESKRTGKLADQANKLYKNRKYVDAIVMYENVKQFNSDDPVATKRIASLSKSLSQKTALFLQRAQKQLNADKYREALLSIKLVLKLVKYSPDKRNARISADYAKKLKIEATKKMNDVLQNSYNRGVAFYRQGNLTRAIQLFNKVYSMDYKYKNVRNLRRNVLNRIVAARKARAKKQQSAIQQLLYTGINYYRNGKYRLAIQTWQRILRISPNHSAARSYIARARFKLGQ